MAEDWSRGVPLYSKCSSFQGIGIEGYYSILRCITLCYYKG